MGFIWHALLICIVGFVYLTVKNTKIVLVTQKNQYSACCVCCLITFKLLRSLNPSHINFLILTMSLTVYSHGTGINLISSRRSWEWGAGKPDPTARAAGSSWVSPGSPRLPARCVYPEVISRTRQFLNSLGEEEKGLGSRESWLLLLR